MGEVYLAHDAALDRPVAIKVLKAAYANDEDFVQRFQREARAAARLSHPNIVQVHAVHIDAQPPYMVMEYVDGLSLDQRIASRKPLPWGNALAIVRQVASALGAAHAQGIVHRDIKPGNIIVDSQGRVRVTDFGIARVLDQATRLTADHMSVGSPCYMSPEQCGIGEVGPHSDLFALGITLYELITGELPFQAENTLGLIRKITTDPIPNLAGGTTGIPPVVQVFLETLTAKDPRYRYAEARQVIEDLNGMHAGQPPVHLTELRAAAKRDGVVPLIPDGWTTQVNLPQTARDLLDDDKPSAFRHRPATKASPRLWPYLAGGAILMAAVAIGTVIGLWVSGTASNGTTADVAASEGADTHAMEAPQPPPLPAEATPLDESPFVQQPRPGPGIAFPPPGGAQRNPGGFRPPPPPGGYPQPGTRPGDPGYGPPPPPPHGQGRAFPPPPHPGQQRPPGTQRP
jgi:serine/threonine protein kinase